MHSEILVKSEELLERIANSMYDRSPDQLVIFTIKESHVVENFLREFARDFLAIAGEY